MALRGAQGDHPTAGREAPAAKDAQPSGIGGSWKAQEGWPERALVGDLRVGGSWKAQRGRPGGVQRGPRRGGSP